MFYELQIQVDEEQNVYFKSLPQCILQQNHLKVPLPAKGITNCYNS